MLDSELNALKTLNSNLVENLKKFKNKHQVNVVTSKQESETMTFTIDGRVYFIHSKYAPESEAKQFIDNLPNIMDYDHVFFFGVGLGYHIKLILSNYPTVTFSIYEPRLEILDRFLKTDNFKSLPYNNLKLIEGEANEISGFIDQFIKRIQGKVLFVTLPSYERIFNSECGEFFKLMQERLNSKKQNLVEKISFQKVWTLNSLKNICTTLNTPSILDSGFKKVLNDCPVIIVSAGPSLDYEIENLKYIKKHKMAYIFSVGSSINTLIENGIIPDAICSYDPKPENALVFKKLIDRKIENIPVVFGSTIGFQALGGLNKLSGPKFHLINSQDTVTPFFLRNSNHNIQSITDSSSIAIIIFQVLCHLKVEKILLVGQNLALKNNIIYAEGIDYNSSNTEKNTIEVKDVYGNNIESTEGLNRMRQELELYIQKNSNIKVINTTKFGAQINGTIFSPLDNVIREELKENTVKEDWYNSAEENYDLGSILDNIILMDEEIKRFNKIYRKFSVYLGKMNKYRYNNRLFMIELRNVMQQVRALDSNEFFNVFLAPMNRATLEIIVEKISNVDGISNLEQIELIYNELARLLNCITIDIEEILPYYNENKELIKKLINRK